MLNVGQLNEGVVLDHIEAGKSMSIYHYLKLDHQKCPQQQNGQKRYHQSRMSG